MNKNAPIRWILLFLIVLACILYFVPRSTPIDLTLNATKFDPDGFEVDTTQITIRGKRLDYLFQKDRMDITIDSIDQYMTFQMTNYGDTNKKGVIYNYLDIINSVTLVCIDSTSNTTQFCDLYFADSLEYLVLYFHTNEGKYTYLASLGDDHSADKVIEHFKSFSFNPLPSK